MTIGINTNSQKYNYTIKRTCGYFNFKGIYQLLCANSIELIIEIYRSKHEEQNLAKLKLRIAQILKLKYVLKIEQNVCTCMYGDKVEDCNIYSLNDKIYPALWPEPLNKGPYVLHLCGGLHRHHCSTVSQFSSNMYVSKKSIFFRSNIFLEYGQIGPAPRHESLTHGCHN